MNTKELTQIKGTDTGLLKTENVLCNICGTDNSEPFATGIDFEYMTVTEPCHMVQCKTCGLVYLNPRPTIDELDKIYPENYNPYHFETIANPIVRAARNFVQKGKIAAFSQYAAPEAVIMDVGCGSGTLLRLMKEFGPTSWHLIGNDFSNHALQYVAEAGIETIAGRFETLDISPNSMNLIILNQVIEHFDNPSAILDKAFEILTPGGHLFIETPSLTGWDAKLFKARYWGGYHFPRHWNLYTPHTLEKHLTQHGFKIVEISALASPSFWVQSFHHKCLETPGLKGLTSFFDFKNPLLMGVFTMIDMFQKNITMTSNMRMVGQKPIDRSSLEITR